MTSVIRQYIGNRILGVVWATFFICALGLSLFAQGKDPVILIPGLAGSELRHKDTGEKVWDKVLRRKSEDLRLPISADLSKNRDKLIAGDIIRKVKLGFIPIADVYGGFIKAMEKRGGYHEEKWESPSENAHQDSLYVFAYDWRLDCVENARLLIRRIEDLKRQLNKPDLKFDIVAHSMGGLITRYAAMYGDADIPDDGNPQPTWAGARHFDQIILMGTPNEGSALSLNMLLNGVVIGKFRVKLPFIHDTSKFMIFTIPSVYQLLPAPGTVRAYNDKLERVDLDIYDPQVWSEYGWNVIDDKDFIKKFNASERLIARDYFAAVLNRARRFHLALAAAPASGGPVAFYVLGADCRTALDSFVLYRDAKANKWNTLFTASGFKRPDGENVTRDALKKVLFAAGDGIVTRRSLEGTGRSAAVTPNTPVSHTFICGEHITLATGGRVQDHIIDVLKEKGRTAPGNIALN